MALVQTPRALAGKADLYRRLGQHLRGGIPILQTLEATRSSPPSRRWGRVLERTLHNLGEGDSFHEALRGSQGRFPTYDLAMIEAGERSGQLDACLLKLADDYEEQARQLRQIWLNSAYPIFIVHFALLLRPLPALVLTWNVPQYLLAVLATLGPLYLLAFVFLWTVLGRHGQRWRAAFEPVLQMVPVAGRARRNLALARLADALGSLLNAGVSILTAWPLAAEASGSPALQREVAAWKPGLEAGASPGELLAGSRRFPSLFISHYRTGEVSGSLDDSLRHLHTLYREEGMRQVRELARWIPILLYVLVMILTAIYIIHSWLNIYSGLFNNLGL